MFRFRTLSVPQSSDKEKSDLQEKDNVLQKVGNWKRNRPYHRNISCKSQVLIGEWNFKKIIFTGVK